MYNSLSDIFNSETPVFFSSFEIDSYWLVIFLSTLFILFTSTCFCPHISPWNLLKGGNDVHLYEFSKDSEYDGKEASVFSIKGRRKHMEDTYQAVPDCQRDGKMGYYGVFDGHGGPKAAAFTAHKLHSYLNKFIGQVKDYSLVTEMHNAITESFRHCDHAFLKEAEQFRWPDGTTAVCAFVVRDAVSVNPTPTTEAGTTISNLPQTNPSDEKNGSLSPPTPHSEIGRSPSLNKTSGEKKPRAAGSPAPDDRKTGALLYVANCGDSRAVLVRRDGSAVPMSIDHKPNRDDERARIEAAGGRVVHFGTWRVEGILAVARAIGDIHLKKWVISQPEIKTRELTLDDTALVLATDGVWDVVENSDVAEICAELYRRDGSLKEKLDYIARRITRTAFDRGSVDNITTLVVDLTSWSTAQSSI